jgi:hypothetical protein
MIVIFARSSLSHASMSVPLKVFASLLDVTRISSSLSHGTSVGQSRLPRLTEDYLADGA